MQLSEKGAMIFNTGLVYPDSQWEGMGGNDTFRKGPAYQAPG